MQADAMKREDKARERRTRLRKGTKRLEREREGKLQQEVSSIKEQLA